MITTWPDFKTYITNLENTKLKGDHFELFCFYMLELYPKYNYKIDRLWMYRDFPRKRKEKLQIPSLDKGTDLIYKLKEQYRNNITNYVSVQCKFVSNEKAYTERQLSTFCNDASILGEGLLISTQENKTVFEHGADNTEHRVIHQIVLPDIFELQRESPSLMKLIIEKVFAKINRTEEPIENNELRYNMDEMRVRPYQKECIDKGVEYFKENNKGIIWSAGGTGKTFMAINLFHELNDLKQNVEPTYKRKLMVVVPSLFLIEQTIKYFTQTESDKNKNFIISFCSISERSIGDLNFTIEEKKLNKHINYFNELENKSLIAIVTYASLQKCIYIFKEANYYFDMIIFDEAHTLVNENKTLSNWFFDNHETLPCEKQLFVSATPKYIVGKSEKGRKKVVSTDINGQFGNVFFKYPMRRAITEGFLSEYRVYIPVSSTLTIKHVILYLSEEHNLMEEIDYTPDEEEVIPIFWRLMVAAFSIKDAFYRGKNKCMAICNTVKDMNLLLKLVLLIFKVEAEDIYAKAIDASVKTDDVQTYNKKRERIKIYQGTNAGV